MNVNGRAPGNPFANGDASRDEMAFGPTTDPQIEMILAGEPPAGAEQRTAELAAVARALRETFVRPPAPELAERHLAAIVAEAHRIASLKGARVSTARPLSNDSSPTAAGESVQASVRRPPTRRGRLVPLRLAAVGLAALLGMSGLAIAGVRPPEPIADGLEALGVSVPGDESADDDDPGTGERGRQPRSGQRRSDAAVGGAATREAAGPGARKQRSPRAGDARGRGDERRRGQRGDEASAEGRETAAAAQAGDTPPPEPGRSEDHSQGQGPPADPGSTAAVSPGAPDSAGQSAHTPSQPSPPGR